MSIGKVFIGVDFVILISILYLLDNNGIFVFALLAAAIHEIGHLLAMKLCGATLSCIRLGIYGVRIEMQSYPLISYGKEIIIALAGPFFGGILALLFSNMRSDTCTLIAGFSAVLTLFNLLPAETLDGGRALKFVSLKLFDETKQIKLSKAGNLFSSLILIALSVYVSIKIAISPSLCIFCAFVSGGFLKELFE